MSRPAKLPSWIAVLTLRGPLPSAGAIVAGDDGHPYRVMGTLDVFRPDERGRKVLACLLVPDPGSEPGPDWVAKIPDLWPRVG